VVVLTILFAFLSILIRPQILQAEDTKQLDIATKLDGYLFNLSNLKPGDQASRILTIQNRGERDFTYKTTAVFKGGDEKLYNEFLVRVSDSNGIIHEGKLKEFKSLAPRFLKSMNEEDLLFELEFPYELGNEFQGLGFEVEFTFIVEGYDPPPPGGGGDGGDSDNPGNPKNPDNPINTTKEPDPDDPDEPENLEDPTNNPIEPQDPYKINPQHSIDPEKLNSPPVDGQILPSTATNIYNYGFTGLGLIAVGGILFFFQRKVKQTVKQ